VVSGRGSVDQDCSPGRITVLTTYASQACCARSSSCATLTQLGNSPLKLAQAGQSRARAVGNSLPCSVSCRTATTPQMSELELTSDAASMAQNSLDIDGGHQVFQFAGACSPMGMRCGCPLHWSTPSPTAHASHATPFIQRCPSHLRTHSIVEHSCMCPMHGAVFVLLQV
jgi:hypothetical protein